MSSQHMYVLYMIHKNPQNDQCVSTSTCTEEYCDTLLCRDFFFCQNNLKPLTDK